MFLTNLFHYNKVLCAALIIYLIFFLVINYKQGAVIAPVYQFGMYSSKMYLQDTLSVYSLTVNGKLLSLSNLSYPERDLVISIPESYQRSKTLNPAVLKEMKKIASQTYLNNLLTIGKYENQINDTIFSNRYEHTVSSFFHINGAAIKMFTQKYVWDKDSVKAVGSPQNFIF